MGRWKEVTPSYTMPLVRCMRRVGTGRLDNNMLTEQTTSHMKRKNISSLGHPSRQRLWLSSSMNGTPTTTPIRQESMRRAPCFRTSSLETSAAPTRLS